ncbi:TPA: hypothetical protein HA235_04460 [Candidatus Woesearchaeota archaeon]|nr:hypothetical protein [Candidatus Woesearchaeota archaeon]HIH31935.1 hypothetical protein [Candidatus Woesearchaeota archaeon]HIH55495.1 hypothetical protein [Candidatus Woesearchaeota archaeon]HIJ01052.1 hypothetical protein [Candidatus Woesearchaeota archaeon]HIJ14723.1 hypothetical protein [Candidatus Woesearchaeota archaeon]
MADPVDIQSMMQILWIFFVVMIFIIIMYVYQSLAFMKIAQKLKTKNPWLAWIPVANSVLQANMAGMHWWPVLLYAVLLFFYIIMFIFALFQNITVVNIISFITYIPSIIISVYTLIWLWRIYEKVSRPGYWAILPVIVIFFFTALLFLSTLYPAFLVISIIGIILGIILQMLFLGVAAWHKNSIVKKSSKK